MFICHTYISIVVTTVLVIILIRILQYSAILLRVNPLDKVRNGCEARMAKPEYTQYCTYTPTRLGFILSQANLL